MQFSDNIRTILLDIVGIVAILGGGSVVRVAQASGLTWQHVIPRLVPAPQAFIKDVRDERLPTERGTVVGVYSGNFCPELNFFAALLHPKKLKRNEVELVEVNKKKAGDLVATEKNVYGAKEFGPLFVPSLLGLILSASISWLSIHCDDNFALAATILLSLSSTVVGFASWWKLDLKEKGPRKDREHQVPEGDVVIHYARLGAFRVVKCDEKISELYFRIESCEYILGETAYRAAWLFATVLLMSGLICLRNSKPELQIAFAASYVILNVLYWACSALNPTVWHWSHDYQVVTRKWLRSNSEDQSFGVALEATLSANTSPKDDVNEIEAQQPLKRRTSSFPSFLTRSATEERGNSPSGPELKYTDALWPAIALVGHSRWVQYARLAPDTGPWKQWIKEAGNIAAAWQVIDKQRQHRAAEASHDSQEVLTAVIDTTGAVKLPAWDYQKRLTDLLTAQPRYEKRAPDWPELVKLRDAGYFPKTKAEAEPLKTAVAQESGQLLETVVEAREPQGASTSVEPTHTEPLQSSSSSTHLGVEGTRLRPAAARARSQESRRRLSVAEGSQTAANMMRNEDGVLLGSDFQPETQGIESQIATKEKAGV